MTQTRKILNFFNPSIFSQTNCGRNGVVSLFLVTAQKISDLGDFYWPKKPAIGALSIVRLQELVATREAFVLSGCLKVIFSVKYEPFTVLSQEQRYSRALLDFDAAPRLATWKKGYSRALGHDHAGNHHARTGNPAQKRSKTGHKLNWNWNGQNGLSWISRSTTSYPFLIIKTGNS